MGQSSHGLFDLLTINLFNFSKFIFLTRSDESSSDSSVASVSIYVKSEVSSSALSSMPLGMDIISPSKPLIDDLNRIVVICSSPFCDLVRDEICVVMFI
tara:strand:- start:1405 stop:1701 length:297 start_codon:yes stop_codon:yes gene_type:complete